jgi:translation initiation factor IF-2
LDYIRKTKVAEREAGGITQSIGAYEIVYRPQIVADKNTDERGLNIGADRRSNQHESAEYKMTFIDTPGHEAFTKMRQRGAHVADIGILVIGADDGVKPQTEEAIEILKNSNTPFVVAINKIDKNNADIERTKNDLLKHGVLLEGFGGDISWHAISAKQGEGVDELLDLVLLMWQIENLTYTPSGPAKGFIIEAKVDSRRGNAVSVVITDGIMREGDNIATPTACGKIKMLENFLGKRVKELEPSSPALILGFETLPSVGQSFTAGDLELEIAPNLIPELKPKMGLSEIEKETMIPVMIKADVSGSLEALAHVIGSLEVGGKKFKIVSEEIGEITDGDVKNAAATGTIIVGFNTKITKSANNLARGQNVKVVISNIIYRIVEALEESIKAIEGGEKGPTMEVLAIFSQKGRAQLIGGKILSGIFTLNQKVNIKRQDKTAGSGRVTSLQQNKSVVKKVSEGEFGLMIESPVTVQVGDVLTIEYTK